MNRHWPVNAMVIVGFSKYEGASSNPAAGIPLRTTMSSLRTHIRHLTVECHILERQDRHLTFNSGVSNVGVRKRHLAQFGVSNVGYK